MRKLVACIGLLAGCAAPTTPNAAPTGFVLEMYQVGEWVVCAGEFAGCAIKDHPQGCDAFVAKVKAAVAPSPWDQDGWAMVVQNGLLIVRASKGVQDQVLAYVTGLPSPAKLTR